MSSELFDCGEGTPVDEVSDDVDPLAAALAAFGLSATTGDPVADAPARPSFDQQVGGLRGVGDEFVAAVLRRFSVVTPEVRSTVEERIESRLADQGIDAKVISIRWGTVVLAADPITARLLRTDHDVLLELLGDIADVNDIRVQVRR